MMGELAASIAHEVNQPLTAVVTNGNACLRWLDREKPNLGEAREAVMQIVSDGNRASEVIQSIRSLVKKSPPQMAPLEINALIGEVLALTQYEVLRNGILVRTELAADIPIVMGDRVQLQQVILNLTMNAIQATSAVGEGPRELVLISQMQGRVQVVIAVRDSGVGIDPKNLDQLFNPFFTTSPREWAWGYR